MSLILAGHNLLAAPTVLGKDASIPISFFFNSWNGIAFVLSMTAVVAVTLLPLSLPTHPRYAVWCGSVLVAVSAGMLMAAFMFAGLVAVGWNAPSPMCAAVHCNEGGVPCSLQWLSTPFGSFGNTSVFAMDQNPAKLNGFNSRALCFDNATRFAFDSDPYLPSDALCASEVPTAVSQTQGLSSSLNAYPQNLPLDLRPITNGSLSDLLQALDPQSFIPLRHLRYICDNASLGGASKNSKSSLCDRWAQGLDTADHDGHLRSDPLSVSPSGGYLTAATLLASGGVLFSQEDIIINTAGSLEDSFWMPNAALKSWPLPVVLVLMVMPAACLALQSWSVQHTVASMCIATCKCLLCCQFGHGSDILLIKYQIESQIGEIMHMHHRRSCKAF